MPLRSRMSLYMGQIEPEHPELFALEFAEYDFVYTLSSTNIDFSAPKLGQTICDHKILGEFNYGSNRTRTVRVICP